MRRLAFACASVLALTTSARADVELKNDGFVTNDMAGFQGGFVSGEAGASRFTPPMPGVKILKLQFLWGGAATTKTATVKIWDDTAGTDAPGTELFVQDYDLTGSDSSMSEVDLSANDIHVPGQFRAGIVFQHDGAPSIAHDNDGTIAADKNFILAQGLGWTKSKNLGLSGDWIIRAIVEGAGPNPNPNPDGGGAGAACTGNPDCPIGQYCEPTGHACTFDCRTSDDCGGGTCNSLGQCLSDGKGGGCSAGGGGGLGLGLAVGALVSSCRRRSTSSSARP